MKGGSSGKIRRNRAGGFPKKPKPRYSKRSSTKAASKVESESEDYEDGEDDFERQEKKGYKRVLEFKTKGKKKTKKMRMDDDEEEERTEEQDRELMERLFNVEYGIDSRFRLRVDPGDSPSWREMGKVKPDPADSSSESDDEPLLETIETAAQRQARHERARVKIARSEARKKAKEAGPFIDPAKIVPQTAALIEPRPAFDDKESLGAYRLGYFPDYRDEPRAIDIPAPINTYLFPHQRDGVQFLFDRYARGEGGLLLDDMGLGKTIQVIAFLAAIRRLQGGVQNSRAKYAKSKATPHANVKWPLTLILAPAAVLENWGQEIETWSHLVYRIHGKDDWQGEAKNGFLDIVIMSHTASWQKELDVYRIPWKCVIIDEMHTFKNLESNAAAALAGLPRTVVRFGLTGTAIQNDLQDAYSLIHLVCPQFVPSPAGWEKYFAGPYLEGFSLTAEPLEAENAAILRFAYNTFFSPRFSLRRTKALIADQLPRKTEIAIKIAMTHVQWALYNELLLGYKIQKERRDELLAEDPEWLAENNHLFFFLHKLRAVSNHAALVYPSAADEFSKDDEKRRQFAVLDSLCTSVFGRRRTLQNRDISDDAKNMDMCGKWERLLLDLDAWKDEEGGSKVLIFSRSLSILEWITRMFKAKAKDYTYLTITGETQNRQEICRQFNTDPSIFMCLISTKAGGTGLNLTGANRVIIFDADWNPAFEQQAMDRAHRIGQKRDVLVHRYISDRTIEETIYLRQRYKLSLSEAMIDGKAVRSHFDGVKGDDSNRGDIWGSEALTNPMRAEVFEKAMVTTFEEEVGDLLLAAAAQATAPKLEPGVKSENGARSNRAVRPAPDERLDMHLQLIKDDPATKVHFGTDFTAEQLPETRLNVDSINQRRIERYGRRYRDVKPEQSEFEDLDHRKPTKAPSKRKSSGPSNSEASGSGMRRQASMHPRSAGLGINSQQPALRQMSDEDLKNLHASLLVRREATEVTPSLAELPALLGCADVQSVVRLMNNTTVANRSALMTEAIEAWYEQRGRR